MIQTGGLNLETRPIQHPTTDIPALTPPRNAQRFGKEGGREDDAQKAGIEIMYHNRTLVLGTTLITRPQLLLDFLTPSPFPLFAL